MEQYKIIKGVGGLYTVTDGTKTFNCKARGLFRKEKIVPCIGDNVLIDDDGCIETILERKNILIRPPVANIDRLGIVVSAERPVADLQMLDKLTVTAFAMNIEPFVIINKTDIEEDNAVSHIKEHLFGTGIDSITVNCKSNDGLSALLSSIKPGITSFAGQSGVGKTSILSVLLPEEHLEVGTLSDKLERGRHTTRHVELHDIGNGRYIMDTPGFSKYDCEVADIEELCRCFPEFRQFDKKCAFNSCTHLHEPDCAIREAVKNGIISKSRYRNYVKITEEIKSRKVLYK